MYTCQMMFIPGHGDLCIGWSPEHADKVAETIGELMKKNITFWIVEKVGTIRPKITVTEVTDPATQMSSRKVYIKDADINALLNSGLAEFVSFAGENEIKPLRKARDAKEAATANTLAMAPREGG